MIRILKELYLTEFTLLYRYPFWGDAQKKARRAVSGLSVFVGLALIAIESWMQILSKTKFYIFPAWVLVLFSCALCLANDYVLVTRGHGIKFERQFDHIKKPKRVLLVASCVVIMLAFLPVFIYSIIIYRRFLYPS